MQLLQLYRCIYVLSMMIVAFIVCEIQTKTSSSTRRVKLLTMVNLITDADKNANADTNAKEHVQANEYSGYDAVSIA